MSKRERIKDPLIGFGWAGYVCAGVLVVLVSLVVAGVEVRYALMKLILGTLGVVAMILFVSRLVFVGIAIFGLSMSVVSGVGILVAFCIAPYRVRPVVQWVVFVLCTAWFLVPMLGMGVWYRAGLGGSFRIHQSLEVLGVVLVGAVLLFVTRSKFVGLMWLGAVLLVAANAVCYQITSDELPGAVVLFYPFDYFWFTSYSLIFQLLTAGSVVYWAVVERRRVVPERACVMCGYDLVGLHDDGCCPECGESVGLGAE